MARVLVACFALEANSFAPGETTIDDYRDQTLAIGGAIGAETLGSGSEFAAAWRTLESSGHEPVPSVIAWSAPRPPLTRTALAEIVRLACGGADAVDGAYVMLHGSAAAHGEDDPEGVLLAALRERLGPDRPLAASLDCHANVTPRMVDSLDIATAYRTCPHTDVARAGEQAARLLAAALRSEIRPVVALAGAPMITPADLHDSSRDPFRRLMSLCDEAEGAGVLAAALFPVQPWLDLPELGWKAAVTADGDRASAGRIAEGIMREAWTERHSFLGGRRPAVAEALAEALRGPGPVVLADAGDSPSGGSPGDSTELLRAALGLGRPARILLSLRDPAAAAVAFAAGVGAHVDVELGSGERSAYNERVSVRALVLGTFDGEFRYSHPFAAGYRATTGQAALVGVDGIEIALHSHIVMLIDPALFHALGARPERADVVQAKSHVSYRAGFAPVTERSIVADTPGPTSANLARLPYRRVTRPLFPLDDDAMFAGAGSDSSAHR